MLKSFARKCSQEKLGSELTMLDKGWKSSPKVQIPLAGDLEHKICLWVFPSLGKDSRLHACVLEGG